MMKIGIDATALPPQPVGAGNYIIQLIRALADLTGSAEYHVFAQPHGQALIGLQESPKVIFHPMPSLSPARRLLWEQTRFPGIIRRSGIDLLHSLHYTMPLSKPVPQVVTLHDLTYFIYPKLHVRSKRYFFKAFIYLSGRRADALVTYSQSTRQDAIRLVNIPPKKLTNAPLGVTLDFHPIQDQARLNDVRQKYTLPEQFILFVGLLEPRKNLTTLLKAYHAILPQIKNTKLVIVGRKGWMNTQLQQVLEDLELNDHVHFTGYVDQADMPGVYNLADIFVYPSLYEGFGLPVLEAMACGTPVITSNVSSLPEIVANAGKQISPLEVEDLSRTLRELLINQDLRRELSQRGVHRAAQFTWQQTARITNHVYQQVLAAK